MIYRILLFAPKTTDWCALPIIPSSYPGKRKERRSKLHKIPPPSLTDARRVLASTVTAIFQTRAKSTHPSYYSCATRPLPQFSLTTSRIVLVSRKIVRRKSKFNQGRTSKTLDRTNNGALPAPRYQSPILGTPTYCDCYFTPSKVRPREQRWSTTYLNIRNIFVATRIECYSNNNIRCSIYRCAILTNSFSASHLLRYKLVCCLPSIDLFILRIEL